MIIESRVNAIECDYNFHKSNSTYFSDLDVARAHCVAHIFRRGIDKVIRELKLDKGRFAIGLGGVHCSFKKEIKPYERYEIWTRVLSWDRKWVYVVSHLVKAGTVKPKGYTLQPWKKISRGAGGEKGDRKTNAPAISNAETPAQPHPAIFASSIAKYVFKKGRLTISPVRILEASAQIPPKPVDVPTPAGTASPMPEGASNTPESTSQEPAVAAALERLTSLNTDEKADATLTARIKEDDGWDWQRVEDERLRGMKLAELFSGLDGLSGEFRGEEDHALGTYSYVF